MFRSFVCLALLASVLPVPPTYANPVTGATSLGDLSAYPEIRDSYPEELTGFGGLVYFSAHHETSGRELWVSDGTADGTFLVKDINPGFGGSNPRALTELNGQLFFTAGEFWRGLWATDGTTAGTRQITGGVLYEDIDVGEIVVFNGSVYMSGDEKTSGSELWRYSPGADELVQVADIVPGPGSSNPELFKIIADRLVFNTSAGLYVIDAGADSAEPFLEPGAEELRFSSTEPATEYDGRFYFQASTPDIERKLWRTDGTAEGTELFMNIGGDNYDSGPHSLVVYNGSLYFISDGIGVGENLFFTDSNPSNIQILYPQAESISAPWPREITAVNVVNEVMYFLGKDAQGEYLLWRSNGTVEGSAALQIPADIGAFDFLWLPFSFQGKPFLFSYSSDYGTKLWRIVDGKSIESVADSGPVDWSSSGDFAIVNNTAYFSGVASDAGVELWATDGMLESTRQVANINPDDSADSRIGSLAPSDDRVLFIGPASSRYGTAVWRTGGTPGSTRRLHSFEAAADSGEILSFAGAGGLLQLESRAVFYIWEFFFRSQEYVEHQWAIDGDHVYKIDNEILQRPVRLGDKALMSRGGDLWGTNGQIGSVRRITWIGEGSYNTNFFNQTTASDNYVWFFSGTEAEGSKVWRSDGTAEGTVPVADVTDDPYSRRYFALDTYNEEFYFLSAKNSEGVRLWRTSEDGAVLLGTIEAGWYGSASDILEARFARLGETLLVTYYFSSGGGSVLVATDGTTEGTRRLGTYDEVGGNIIALNGYAYFMVYDEETRTQTLWKSDGTPDGTQIALDPGPNASLGSSSRLALHNGAIYLVINSAASGEEIWKTDGGRAVQVTELLPGTLSADPRYLQSIGGRLYFRAWVPGQGRELMVLDE